MKSSILFLLFLLVFSLDALAFVLNPGEKIHYNVIQLGLKAGEATLSYLGHKKYQGKDTVFIDFQSQGLNFSDHEKIYLDPKRLKPLFVERQLNIFGQREDILEQYTLGHIKITKTSSGKTTQQVIDKAGWMDNIYAFIYRYRQSGKFQINEQFDIHLPTKDVKIILVKQDSMTIAKEKHQVFYMQSKPAKYKIWFDASEKKIPLRISGAIGLANTSMVMTSYEK